MIQGTETDSGCGGEEKQSVLSSLLSKGCKQMDPFFAAGRCTAKAPLPPRWSRKGQHPSLTLGRVIPAAHVAMQHILCQQSSGKDKQDSGQLRREAAQRHTILRI